MKRQLDNFYLGFFIIAVLALLIHLYDHRPAGYIYIIVGMVGCLMFANSLRKESGRAFRRKRYGSANILVMLWVLLKEKLRN